MKKLLCALMALVLAMAATGVLAEEPEMPLLGEDSAIGQLPGKQWEFHSLTKNKVTKVAQITGEDSENKTQSRFGVWGTDLGSMAQVGDRVYMFGGDTFGNEDSAHWRSNVLFIIEDDDPSDGLTIVDAVTDRTGRAKELLSSQKLPGTEHTVIPTNIFAIDETLYCIYMSVSVWGDPGEWTCRYSGLARSEDLGQTWKKLTDVRWPGDSNFIQTANYQVGDMMYFWGIPGGRTGGVAVMKVPVDKVEDYESYLYYVGDDEKGEPKWVQGSEGVMQAKVVIEDSVGEISVIYNEYLGNFLLTYLSHNTYTIVMREGLTPWGEWSKPYTLVTGAQYPSLYGAYMLPQYVEENGKVVYFAMSQFFPIYNIMWMRAELP